MSTGLGWVLAGKNHCLHGTAAGDQESWTEIGKGLCHTCDIMQKAIKMGGSCSGVDGCWLADSEILLCYRLLGSCIVSWMSDVEQLHCRYTYIEIHVVIIPFVSIFLVCLCKQFLLQALFCFHFYPLPYLRGDCVVISCLPG